MHSVLLALLTLLCLYLLQTALEFRRNVRAVGHLSVPRVLISPVLGMTQLLRRALPPFRYLIRDSSWIIKNGYQEFAAAGQDAFAMVSAWPPQTMIYLADADAIKEVSTSRVRFPKPVEKYKVVAIFGSNIVASEGEEWKRYRTIAAPAFSERNTRLVWDETIRIMFDLFDNVWGDKPEIVVDHCVVRARKCVREIRVAERDPTPKGGEVRG